MRIVEPQRARAVIAGEARHIALQRLQRGRRRFQIDEPQLDHARVPFAIVRSGLRRHYRPIAGVGRARIMAPAPFAKP